MEELTKARKLYTPCLHCGLPLYPQELLCPHCKTPVESRLPRLDWARAQVLTEYKQQRKRSRLIDLYLMSTIIVVPMILYFFLNFFFVFGKIFMNIGTRRYSELAFSGLALIHYYLITHPYLILCGLPITATPFEKFGSSIFYRISRNRKYYPLYHFFPCRASKQRRIYLLYRLLALLLSLHIGHFFLIPSMRRYIYEGKAPFLTLFLKAHIDIPSQLPALDRFFSAYCFLYYALCFFFFVIYVYRYATEKDSLYMDDVRERCKAVGIPVPDRRDW
ncbi:MAG: hypothetical protein Q4A78_00620 [Peptostreptococcaceae bacterium]|nr:hypothetical protein [Peptostreptococcaceae bacterium]